MGLFFPLLGAFALAVILVYLFARPKGPDAGRRLLKRAGAGTLLAIGGVLAVTGKVAVGVPLIAVGLYLWRPAILEPGAAIEDGTVRLGPFAGRTLASLGRDELVQLYVALASRPRDRAVLEAHLDRRIPGWREDFQRGHGRPDAPPVEPRAP